MKVLVIINNSYPFFGETFLENELNYINGFDKVILNPLFNNEFIDFKKDNIILNNCYKKRNITDLIESFFYSFKFLIFSGELKLLLRKKGFIRNVIKSLKFTIRSRINEVRIFNFLKENLVSSSDEITFYSYWLYETALIAVNLSKRFKDCNVISRGHGFDIYEYRHKHNYMPYRNYIFQNLDKIFTISKDGYNYILNNYNLDNNKVSIRRLGTNKKYKNRYCKVGDKITLVSCSNIVSVKRIDKLIHSLSEIKYDLNWYHFGDGELINDMIDLAKNLPPNINYKFMGQKTNDFIQNFYANNYIDVFINVSESEGVPVSVMEAMSYSIPILATDVGGTSEIVKHKKNGYLLNKNFSIQEFLNGLDNICNNFEYRNNSYEIWYKHCNAEKIYSNFYKEIINMEVR